MASEYDDELWLSVPEEPGPPPRHLSRFVQALPAVPIALDLGCGDGRLSASLRAARVTLADVSGVALGRAARRLPDADVVELEPDAPLPLPDSAFDLVLCAETIEHVRDVQKLLSEARRVLRPAGRLALTTPTHGRTTAAKAVVVGLDRVLEPMSPHIRVFTRRSLRRVLEETGFDVVDARRERRTLLVNATR